MFWNVDAGRARHPEALVAEAEPSPLQENYGRKEAEKVARVKALYEELQLPAAFRQFEEDSYGRLMGLIGQHASPLPPAIFLGLAHKIYKRKK